MLHRIILASVDSTNKYVEERKGQLSPPTLVIGIQQRHGKGQGTNRWDSKKGDLTFTLFCSLGKIDISSFFILSQIVSLEIVSFLLEYGIQARIKWPNDILVGLEKICGILIQTHVENGVFSSASVGIGLNLTRRDKSPAHYNPPATSIENQLGASILNPIAASEVLAKRILASIENYTSNKAQQIRAAYWEYLFRNQGMHPFIIHEKKQFARILSVCNNGQLHLQDEHGKEYQCSFKELKFVF